MSGKAPPDSFRHLLKVMSNPNHPDYKDSLVWFDGSFDLEEFDAVGLGKALSEKKAEEKGNLYDGSST